MYGENMQGKHDKNRDRDSDSDRENYLIGIFYLFLLV